MVMKNGDKNQLDFSSPALITSTHHQYSSPLIITTNRHH